jgi:hypothetical protein
MKDLIISGMGCKNSLTNVGFKTIEDVEKFVKGNEWIVLKGKNGIDTLIQTRNILALELRDV